MSKKSIRLDPDRVAMLIERSGKGIKSLAQGMSEKSVHRMKAGQNTTWATARKLATGLGTTVEVLMSPLTDEDTAGFLPQRWLYHELPPRDNLRHLPFLAIIGGGASECMIGSSPVDFITPLEKLLTWQSSGSRKILLRRDDGGYVFEMHQFDYSPDRGRRVDCHAGTACRFYPLVRNGDNFSKAPLSKMLDRYVWTRLREEAVKHAEIVAIEGFAYPAHPDAYLPLVRFHRGLIVNRVALGSRLFQQMHGDFRCSLIDYLSAIDAGRIRARTSGFGIVVTIEPIRPVPFRLNWQDDVLEFEIDLVWRTPDGKFELAPWRQAHRQQLADAITNSEWNRVASRGMPCAYFAPDGEEDAETPPFEADPSLSPDTIVAIDAVGFPSALMAMWEE
jgi:hypothetical protein